MSLLTIFFVMKLPDVAIEYMQRGLQLCVSVVIPSLFPFMVASELIVTSGATSVLKKPLGMFSRRLFGISGRGATAFLLGTLCGFPIGTRAAVSMYKRGEISFDELSRLVCFSNNPSSAFVISAVGVTLYGCRSFGVALYFITVLSSVIVGVGQNLLLGSGRAAEAVLSENDRDMEHKGIAQFSGAVSGAAHSMLSVCGFVVFFSTFTGTLGEVALSLGLSEQLRALLFSVFELTSGAASAACVKPLKLSVLIVAFALGWSGLSVHFQVVSICEGTGVRVGRYFLAKLWQGIVNVILVWAYFLLFGDRLSFEVESVGVFSFLSAKPLRVGILTSFILLVLLLLMKLYRDKKK